MEPQQSSHTSFLDRLAENVEQSMGVKAVFGAPVERDGTTVIPVAKTRWGLGGGLGPAASQGASPATGGGGGGLIVPIGFIEVCKGGATYRPIPNQALRTALRVALAWAFFRTAVRLLRLAARR